jgi:hypothetical protein
MHQGCVAGANEGGREVAGWWPDIAKLSVGREEYYTRELATQHHGFQRYGPSPDRPQHPCPDHPETVRLGLAARQRAPTMKEPRRSSAALESVLVPACMRPKRRGRPRRGANRPVQPA